MIGWPYRILIVAVLAAASWGHGYVSGLDRESDRRDAEALKQYQAGQAAFNLALESGRRHAEAVIEWQRRARIYYRKWQERMDDVTDDQLAQCVSRPQPTASYACLLGPDWVGLYNDAWFPDGSADTGGTAGVSIGAGGAENR